MNYQGQKVQQELSVGQQRSTILSA
jgi:hypothetical protein